MGKAEEREVEKTEVKEMRWRNVEGEENRKESEDREKVETTGYG